MSGYRMFRVSDETAFDLVRALWLADRANAREGIQPANPAAREKEALKRIILEWSAVVVGQLCHEPGFGELCAADWRCGCGSSGLGSGGLHVAGGVVYCSECLAKRA